MTQETKPFLQQAHELINGQRRQDYGPAHENFTQIAVLWSGLFAKKLNQPITATEVAMAMQLLKMARLLNQPTHFDSQLDNASYAALIPVIQAAQDSGEPLKGILK